MKLKDLKSIFWGSSVALSWMWGLGLFFSVQFTHQFGLFGLFSFAIPNALGLILFGIGTEVIARSGTSSESLSKFFDTWSRPFRLILYLYQILALTLTVFAIINYLWEPLELSPRALYLPLVILLVLAAGCLFGEEFGIRRIKYSHAVLMAVVLVAIGIIIYQLNVFSANNLLAIKPVEEMKKVYDLHYWGFFIPICIGLILGPWLDLQQWQRAIQMRRENISCAKGYIIGALIFFSMLIFHGLLALWVMEHGVGESGVIVGLDGFKYAQGMISTFFWSQIDSQPLLFIAYSIFISICILTTLDSGYIALRWFLTHNCKSSKHMIFSIIPEKLISSPVPSMVFAGVFTLAAVLIGLQLEYFMIFYATFFVGYAALGITRCYSSRYGTLLPQIKMFCVGSIAVVIFANGYFHHQPLFQIFASLLPLGYVLWLIFKPYAASEFVVNDQDLDQPLEETAAMPAPVATVVQQVNVPPSSNEQVQAIHHDVGGHFEGKWFVHHFIATYADTNSVGNVYFGMYAMWVGKSRELFFNKCLPKFNLKTSPYYILTRSFEHKFLKETHEFEEVSVRIRVGKYNRKFAILEHEIYDSHKKLLGKGEQSLMFVSSADYSLIDIPQEVLNAFLAYT